MTYGQNVAPVVTHMIGNSQNTLCGQWSSNRFHCVHSESAFRAAGNPCKRCVRSLGSPKPVHALDTKGCYSLCGRDAHAEILASEVESDVTCKRCLAAIAKRNRSFQRKSRDAMRYVVFLYNGQWNRLSLGHPFIPHAARFSPRKLEQISAQAVALEEGLSK